jgi:hypothetical protein
MTIVITVQIAAPEYSPVPPWPQDFVTMALEMRARKVIVWFRVCQVL